MNILKKLRNLIKPKRLKGRNYDTTDIVVVVYNQLFYTKKTIESIAKHTENYRLIIVNNNSDAETTNYINELGKLNEVTVIQNSTNVGYTKAVNQGLALTQGDVVLANNDIIVTKNWLQLLKKHLTDNTGIVSGVTNQASGFQQLPDMPELNLNDIEQYSEFRQKTYKDYFISFPRVIFFCTLISRKCLNEVGMLDEIFSPGNFEDDDFCRRAETLGYDTRIAFDCFIYHFGSVSFQANGGYRELIKTNARKFIQKHGGSPEDFWEEKFQQIINEMKHQPSFKEFTHF